MPPFPAAKMLFTDRWRYHWKVETYFTLDILIKSPLMAKNAVSSLVDRPLTTTSCLAILATLLEFTRTLN
jgi:hypothetical protein